MTKPKLTPTFKDQIAGNGHLQTVTPSPSPAGPVLFAVPRPQGYSDFSPPIAPVVEPLPLKIAMIGTAPSSRLLAPYADPSWKIWACSPGNQNVLPRADVWFELHGNLLWPENKHYGEPYIEWLKRLTIPLYMQDQSFVPNAISYPKIEMVKEFGRDFFTSSFAWMMALAITQGAKEMALYGIDMASRDEYILQRPSFYFFKHVAEQRGIKVSAPHESDIMQAPGLYGYSEVMPFGRKLAARSTEIHGRLNGMRPERDKLHHNITYLEGAAEDIDYMQSIWSGVADEILLLRHENEELKKKIGDTHKVAAL